MTNNAGTFLTDEQLGVVLNSPGSLFDASGSPAADDTLGSELSRYFSRYGKALIAVDARFERVKTTGGRDGGPDETALRIASFSAWTRTHVLIVLDSIFCDKYLAVLPRDAPGSARVEVIDDVDGTE